MFAIKQCLCQVSWFSSVQFSMFSHSEFRVQSCPTLWPHELQHARPPCPSPTPRVYSNSCLLSWWCHPTISSSVVPFSCLRSFPASGSFPISQFFSSGDQSFGVSASASVLPVNIQDWFPLGLTGWISLQSKRPSKSFLQHHSSEASILQRSAFFTVQLSHPSMTTGKTIASTRQTFVGKVMSLLFNMLSRLVITFFQGARLRTIKLNERRISLLPLPIPYHFRLLRGPVQHQWRLPLTRGTGTLMGPTSTRTSMKWGRPSERR